MKSSGPDLDRMTDNQLIEAITDHLEWDARDDDFSSDYLHAVLDRIETPAARAVARQLIGMVVA